MKNKNFKNSGIGFISVLTSIFIVLKIVVWNYNMKSV